jgi:threonine/homoserine/homoserine lactone efflux protein
MEQFLALAGFAIVLSVTPGPNVLMVAAAAATHGARATWPHMWGIALGFGAMLAMVGLGLGAPIQALPWLQGVMRWVGAAWIIWLAWQIATAPPPGDAKAAPPLGFWGAAAFQWINPKAWMICAAVATTYLDAQTPLLPQLAWVSGMFILACIPCTWVWAAFGAAMGRWLREPARLRAFNIGMALLLVLSLWPMLRG